MTSITPINGLILNGGTSSRMGRPKGEINYHNTPQQLYLFDVLSSICEEVYFSVKEKSNSFPYPQIEDCLSMSTPLNGIYSALKFSPNKSWLVVAIDMPRLDQQSLAYLMDHRNTATVATCYYDSSGKRPEPLVSIWEPTSVPFLETFIQNGGVSPRNFLEESDVTLVKAENQDILLNINSKEELSLYNKNSKG